MSVLEDSDAEISKAFDERVRLRRRKVLSNITNTPMDDEVKQHKKNGNVFFNALHNPALYYGYVDPQKVPTETTKTTSDKEGPNGDGRNISLEVIESPVKKDGLDPGKRGDSRVHEGAAMSVDDGQREYFMKRDEDLKAVTCGDGNRKKVVFRDIVGTEGEEIKGNDVNGIKTDVDDVNPTEDQEVSPSLKASKDRDQGYERNKEMDEQKKVLLRIQGELEELKEAHRRALRVKSKLIKVMEREVAELKQRLETKKKEEIESLKKHYNKMFLARGEAYKEVCRQKILEYKNALDEAYRKKAAEYQGKCSEVINRLKELYKEKKRKGLKD